MDAIETLAWLKSDRAPWHAKGNILDEEELGEKITSEVAIKAGGLDWDVGLFGLNYNFNGENILSPSRELLRLTDGARLNTVGPGFEPVQNRDAFKFMDKAIGEGVEYRVVGSLMGGKHVFILVTLPDFMNVKGDEIKLFLLLTNGHGEAACRILPTPIRVVCWNTLNAALGGKKRCARTLLTLKHTKNVKEKLFDFAKVLERTRKLFGETQELYDALADKNVDTKEVDYYVSEIIPAPEDAKTNRALKRREHLVHLFEEGAPGSDLAAAKGTAWGLYNATTYMVDHERGKQENRLYNSWLGSGVPLKEHALQTAASLLD